MPSDGNSIKTVPNVFENQIIQHRLIKVQMIDLISTEIREIELIRFSLKI